jgi:hypothetical protein
MKRKPEFATAVFTAMVLVVLAGLIAGCVARENARDGKAALAPAARIEPATPGGIERFADAVRPVDGSADAHYRLGLFFQQRYRHKLAIDEFEKTLRLDPAHARARNAMGVSFDNLGDHDTAIHHYRRALAVDPRLDYVHNNLGYSCLLKGDVGGAIEAFQAAIALNGQERRYRNNLALAYAKVDDYDRALKQLKAVGSDVEAVAMLAKVMLELGKPGDAKAVAARAEAAPRPAPAPPAQAEAPAGAPAAEGAGAVDPVARFDSLKDRMRRAEEPAAFERGPAAAAPAAEVLSGPVIRVASAPPSAEPPAAYPVAAVRLAAAPEPPPAPAVKHRPIEPPAIRPFLKEPREIPPPPLAKLLRPHSEEEVERILVASAGTRAAGWQAAPEPRATIEKETGVLEIVVENGNGVKGAAARVARHLRQNGFHIVRVADANSFDHVSTKVFYCSGSLAEVRRMLAALPEIAAEAELFEDAQASGRAVRLLIGRDLIEKNRELTWSRPAAPARHS